MKRFSIAVLAVLALTGAAAADGPQTPPMPPPAAVTGVTPSVVFPGTQSFTGPRRRQAPAAGPSDVTLNFPNADVHEVAKAILGDILGLNYAVDPSATGSVTVQTAEPVARADVLPILEESLSAARLGLIRKGSVYTIIPIDKAKKQPQLLTAGDPGFGSESITLHFVNAVELKKLLDPLVPDNAIAQADAGRNIVVITGTADQRNAIRGLVQQFDVNWLHGMSFALLVPDKTDAHMLQPELDAIVNTQGSPTQGLVKLVVIDRVNGILAISPQPQYLKDLKKWMEILDRAGGDNERKLFVYRVQNGRAADVASVLINAFGGGSGTQGLGGEADRAQPHRHRPALADPERLRQHLPAGRRLPVRRRVPARRLGRLPVRRRLRRHLPDQQQRQRQLAAVARQHHAAAAERVADHPASRRRHADQRHFAHAAPVQDRRRQRCASSTSLRSRVVIEAAISEVSLTKELRFGVQWLLQHGPQLDRLHGRLDGGADADLSGPFGLLLKGDIAATLNALQSITRGQGDLLAQADGPEQPFRLAAGRRSGSDLDRQSVVGGPGRPDRGERDPVPPHGRHPPGHARA